MLVNFENDVYQALTAYDKEEEGEEPLDSDTKLEEPNISDLGYTKQLDIHNNSSNATDFYNDISQASGGIWAMEEKHFHWMTEGKLDKSLDLTQQQTSGTIKANHLQLFQTPLSSMFAFISLHIFKGIAMYSNIYVLNLIANSSATISRVSWKGNISHL